MFTPLITRRISALVLVTFTSLALQPLQAAQVELAKSRALNAPSAPQSPGEQYGRHLDDIKTLARDGKGKANKHESTRDHTKALRARYGQLTAIEAQVERDFDATEADLAGKNLPPEILARHRAAAAEYRAKKTEFKQKLKALEDADDSEDEAGRAGNIGALSDWLEQNQKSKTHTPADPGKLPFGAPDGKVRPPKESEQEFHASLFKTKPTHLAGPIPNGFTLPAATLPATPTAEDLAATEDIALTPAIRALAASLDHSPVKIYNWVRNNIEYLPTYGSIQGADMTLQTKRGNSSDTASLLIGLLRASNIPARYVYGTIQIPADQAMNWVGSATKPEAAQQLMGQGGIPNIGMTQGGIIKYIKLEHVWAEAYVDYVPSRGAVNRTPDTWVPMDASYKQYTYTQGMDIKGQVPLDAQALITQAQAGATVDPSGWVQNVNGANIQSALTGYQTRVKNYIDTTKPGATVGDVIGTKTILQTTPSILMGVLPYTTVATGAKLQSLPAQLRHKFRYNLYAGDIDRAMGSPVLALEQSLPSLAGKKITLSFAPATQADADLIAGYLPKPHADGTPILPAELPSSLPGYLIRLKAEMRVDGQVVSTGGTFTMGQELLSSMGLFDPSTNNWDYGADNRPVAGEYIATHVDLQGVSQAQLQALKDRLAATQVKLASNQLIGLTKEYLSGDGLYLAALSYFATNQAVAQIGARASGVVEYRKPSFGNFMASAQPQYWFGIPRNVGFHGLVMDIDRYASIAVAKDNSSTIGYVLQSGMRLSAYEHLIPEKLFTDPLDPDRPQGVSAVKALALAAGQGQKIFTLNQANRAQHQILLAQITIDPQAMAEIQNGLAAGKEVAIHQAPISQSGWTGSGYIITDPATGSGAYKIAGGENGAKLMIILSFLLIGVIALAPLLMGGLTWGAAIAATLAINQAVNYANALEKIALLPTDRAFAKLNEYLFLVTLEAFATPIFAYLQSVSLGVDLFKWTVWDYVITLGVINVFGFL